MNLEKVLAAVAARIDAHLPAGNPWQGRLTSTVEDPKPDTENTWACVHATGSPVEIVEGNATYRAGCRVYAQVVPTEGEWSAAQLVQFADELADALRYARADLWPPAHGEDYVVLGLHTTDPAVMRAEPGVGYVALLPFTLSVQF